MIGARDGGLGKAAKSQDVYDRSPKRIPVYPVGLLLLLRIRTGSEPVILQHAIVLLLLICGRDAPQHLWIELWITFCVASQPLQTLTITESKRGKDGCIPPQIRANGLPLFIEGDEHMWAHCGQVGGVPCRPRPYRSPSTRVPGRADAPPKPGTSVIFLHQYDTRRKLAQRDRVGRTECLSVAAANFVGDRMHARVVPPNENLTIVERSHVGLALGKDHRVAEIVDYPGTHR